MMALPDGMALGLRDVFALQALQAMNTCDDLTTSYEAWAKAAYELADHMLEQRCRVAPVKKQYKWRVQKGDRLGTAYRSSDDDTFDVIWDDGVVYTNETVISLHKCGITPDHSERPVRIGKEPEKFTVVDGLGIGTCYSFRDHFDVWWHESSRGCLLGISELSQYGISKVEEKESSS